MDVIGREKHEWEVIGIDMEVCIVAEYDSEKDEDPGTLSVFDDITGNLAKLRWRRYFFCRYWTFDRCTSTTDLSRLISASLILNERELLLTLFCVQIFCD